MKSTFFQARINERDFPRLYRYLTQVKHADTLPGSAKKFFCETVEEQLRRQEMQKEETQEHAELLQRLDEIRQMLRSGVRVPSETVEELKQESSRVKDSLRALMA